jgi:hypothetical protein
LPRMESHRELHPGRLNILHRSIRLKVDASDTEIFFTIVKYFTV